MTMAASTTVKKIAHTVEYTQVEPTKGTYKFTPSNDDSPIRGTLYAGKDSSAADLKDAKVVRVTIEVAE